jgi:hypothetical protein
MQRHKQQITPAKRLYRRKTAAQILDCDIQMLRRAERDGRLTPIRLGLKDVFYACAEVDALATPPRARRRPR